jgi:hypothetical protein
MNQKKECNDFIQFINKSVKIIDKKYYTEYIKELKIITNNFIKDTQLSNENINYINIEINKLNEIMCNERF